MTRAFITGISTNGSLAITGPNSPITLNGLSGTSGQVLTTNGTGSTPTWTTPTVTIDQTSLYPGNLYTSLSNYAIDFTGSGAAQGILGSPTRGFPMVAGNTYQFELYFMVGTTFISNTTSSIALSYDFSTISGSPTQTHSMFQQTSSSTVLGAGSAANQSRRTGGGIVLIPTVNTTTTTRFSTVMTNGQVRVGGTGSINFRPLLSATTAMDNSVTVYSDLMFKVNLVGNNSVTTIGTWTT